MHQKVDSTEQSDATDVDTLLSKLRTHADAAMLLGSISEPRRDRIIAVRKRILALVGGDDAWLDDQRFQEPFALAKNASELPKFDLSVMVARIEDLTYQQLAYVLEESLLIDRANRNLAWVQERQGIFKKLLRKLVATLGENETEYPESVTCIMESARRDLFKKTPGKLRSFSGQANRKETEALDHRTVRIKWQS